MEPQATASPKLKICRALTNVVKESTISGSVDPKAFFMMVSSNFQVLYSENTLDLRPLWDALAQEHDSSDLNGLFLRFEDVLKEQGHSAHQPEQIANLSEPDRVTLLAHFEAMESGNVPLPRLNTGDLLPVVDEERQREITQIVSQAIKNAPVGQHLELAQITYLIGSNFMELCDASTFNFTPLLEGLRELPNVTDRDIYAGVARSRAALDRIGIAMEEPDLELSDSEKDELLALAERQEEDAAREREAVLASGQQALQQADAPPVDTTEKKPKKKEARLKALGLGKRSLIPAKVRAVFWVLSGVGVLYLGYINFPNRPLDPTPYQTAIPLRSCRVQSGAFAGVIDEQAWFKLPVPKRKQSFKRFDKIVREKGWLINLQVRDSKGKLVFTNSGPRLISAPGFLLGGPDGIIPEELREERTDILKKQPKKKK